MPYLKQSSVLSVGGIALGISALLFAMLLFNCSSDTRAPLIYLLPAGGLFVGGVVLIVSATVMFLCSRD